jgi:hypothetical protein
MSPRCIKLPIAALIVALAPAVAVADEFRADLIARLESDGGQNIPNFRYTGPGGKYTAGGVCQMTNTTWRRIAPLIDIDITKFDVAGAASEFDQWRACWKLWSLDGYKPWTCDGCNPKLRKALAQAGEPIGAPGAAPARRAAVEQAKVIEPPHDWDVFPDAEPSKPQPSEAPTADTASPQTGQEAADKADEEQPR